MSLITVQSGADYTADAVALDNFSDVAQLHERRLDAARPDAGEPAGQHVVFANGIVYSSLWNSATADPVSAVLMHDHIMNEFVLDAVTKSGTDWVVTMPTKRFYVVNGTGTAGTLFQRNFNKTDGSCDDVDLVIFDREENTTSTPLDFSPPPPGGPTALCWEANVITFNNSDVLGSTNCANIPFRRVRAWLARRGFFPATVTSPIHTLASSDTSSPTSSRSSAKARRRTSACRSSASRCSRSRTAC